MSKSEGDALGIGNSDALVSGLKIALTSDPAAHAARQRSYSGETRTASGTHR